jgi:ribonuclease HI
MRRIIQQIPGSFVQLSANSLLKSSNITHVQTDGSFNANSISRTAVILIKPNGSKHTLSTTYFDHKNSTESEWQSIVDGLEFSMKIKSKTVNLENDNLGVINSLIQSKKPSKLYGDYYYHVLDLVKKMDWVGIRHIPREFNNADKLFRI